MPAIPPPERLAYTPTEVAHALGLCPASVYNMINRGALRAVKLGRSVRIPASELVRLLGGQA